MLHLRLDVKVQHTAGQHTQPKLFSFSSSPTHQLLTLGLQNALHRQDRKLTEPSPSSRHQACFETAAAAAATAAAVRVPGCFSCAEAAGSCWAMVVCTAATCAEGKVNWGVAVVGQAQRLVYRLARVAGREADAVGAERDLGGQLRVERGKGVATRLHSQHRSTVCLRQATIASRQNTDTGVITCQGADFDSTLWHISASILQGCQVASMLRDCPAAWT